MDKYIGRLLDNRYEILEVIGTGGMAVVYKARCHRLNRVVAIKILKDDYLEDEDFASRFHAESQAVAMLSHPNIVSVYDVSNTKNADYIVMELIDGITLKQYMEKKGFLNWKETLHFAIQIAKALEHAHSRGIVHRDIKPHNVMVLKNGAVKVMDFGIARMMSKGNTLTKEALGSVHYISPEQAKGGRVDNRSDIYSLGVVMYEMMSGRPPYDGDSPVSVAIQHINGGAVLPTVLNPSIPGGLEQIIMKAMAHAITDRYNTATEMLRDMDEFRRNPAILFDYNVPPLEEVINLKRSAPQEENPKLKPMSEAGKRKPQEVPATPGKGKQPQQPKQEKNQKPRQEAPPKEEKRSKIVTAAIIACSLVAMAAIGIFLVVLFNGGGMISGDQQITVPQFKGERFSTLPSYPGLEIIKQEEVYDNMFDAGVIIEQNIAAGTKVDRGTVILVKVSKGREPKPVLMHDLIGWTETRAITYLNNLNMNLILLPQDEASETVAKGYVIRTEPAADQVLTDGQTVKIYISTGAQTTQGIMPNLVGMQIDKAVNVLKASYFENYRIEMVESSMDEGKVVAQSEQKSTLVDLTKEIVLNVSLGPGVTLPKDPTGEQTMLVEFDLPAAVTENNYTITVQKDGVVIRSVLAEPGSTSISVALTGIGEQEFFFYHENELLGSKKVVFSSNG